jgi:hypothetical protein
MFKSISNFLQSVFGKSKSQPAPEVPYKIEPPVQEIVEAVSETPEPVPTPVIEKAKVTRKKPTANAVQFPKEKPGKAPKMPVEVKQASKQKKSAVKATPAIKTVKPRSTKNEK